MKCLCASTRNAARLLTRYYEDELRPANITPAQFELLGMVSGRPGLSQSDLAEALNLDQTTLSRNLAVLTGRCWVEREVNANDRRQATYSLTADGHKAWKRALPHWQRAQAHMKTRLGDDWQIVWDVMERLTAAV